MTGHILAFAGRKQSGKSTCVNFLHGIQLTAFGKIPNFDIGNGGQLVVPSDEEGSEDRFVIECARTDMEFAQWASENMWPYVRHFAFADTLKNMAVSLFGIKPEQVFGTNDEKNTPTQYNWEDMPGVEGKSGAMTSREFLQHFGSDLCRKIYPNIWVDACINQVTQSNTHLSLISDVRFPNEIEAVQAAGGKVIRLTRKPFEDSHQSETALDHLDDSVYDGVIDNTSMNIEEQSMKLLDLIKGFGWMDAPESAEEKDS